MDLKHKYRWHGRGPAEVFSGGGYRHGNARRAIAPANKGARQ